MASMGVEIGDVTPANIEQLKTINVNTLPGACCGLGLACPACCAGRLRVLVAENKTLCFISY